MAHSEVVIVPALTAAVWAGTALWWHWTAHHHG